MKFRKLLATVLATTLTLGIAAPALAAEAADQRLTQVTLAVKGTLDIGDEYTEFFGEPDETYLGTRWRLSWSTDSKSLRVTATEEGKVLNYSFWEDVEPYFYPVANSGSFGPTFPAMTMEEARSYGEAFLNKVLAGNETARFSELESESLSATSYSFRGDILLNDTPSPMSFYVRVRLSDGAVTSFSREDVSDYAGTPGAPDTVTTTAKAAALLETTLDMRLEYVWDSDREMAVLRYLPNATDDFYVDAATGALVNLTELRAKLNRQYATAGGDLKAEASMDNMLFATAEAAAPTLTETELAGVAKLEGVLTKEALDQKIRAWSELGLSDYTLGSASYSVNRDTDEVTARVSYAKNTEEGIYRRYVTVDGKDGTLLSMSGYGPWLGEEKSTVTAREAQRKGEAFLKKLWGDQFGKTELYNDLTGTEKPSDWSLTYAQKVNGYFYPANSISVRVDAVTGHIMGFSKGFDDTVTFDDAEGLISLEEAIHAWAGTYPVTFGYMAIPVELDMSEAVMPLRNAGYSYYNALKPGYGYGDRDGWYVGVDAKTGEPVKEKDYTREKMAYDDLTGHWARAALEELARYEVGWFGGKAQPDKALTQLDYVALLASADGYYFGSEQGDIEFLYSYAIRRGILTEADKGKDDRLLTRAEMVKMLLNSLGYGPVAQLPGIFRCDFADAAAIPAADLGYAAIAQALGIVKGDDNGNFAPGRTSTRCEAAYMLWLYMKR